MEFHDGVVCLATLHLYKSSHECRLVYALVAKRLEMYNFGDSSQPQKVRVRLLDLFTEVGFLEIEKCNGHSIRM